MASSSFRRERRDGRVRSTCDSDRASRATRDGARGVPNQAGIQGGAQGRARAVRNEGGPHSGARAVRNEGGPQNGARAVRNEGGPQNGARAVRNQGGPQKGSSNDQREPRGSSGRAAHAFRRRLRTLPRRIQMAAR